MVNKKCENCRYWDKSVVNQPRGSAPLGRCHAAKFYSSAFEWGCGEAPMLKPSHEDASMFVSGSEEYWAWSLTVDSHCCSAWEPQITNQSGAK